MCACVVKKCFVFTLNFANNFPSLPKKVKRIFSLCCNQCAIAENFITKHLCAIIIIISVFLISGPQIRRRRPGNLWHVQLPQGLTDHQDLELVHPSRWVRRASVALLCQKNPGQTPGPSHEGKRTTGERNEMMLQCLQNVLILFLSFSLFSGHPADGSQVSLCCSLPVQSVHDPARRTRDPRGVQQSSQYSEEVIKQSPNWGKTWWKLKWRLSFDSFIQDENHSLSPAIFDLRNYYYYYHYYSGNFVTATREIISNPAIKFWFELWLNFRRDANWRVPDLNYTNKKKLCSNNIQGLDSPLPSSLSIALLKIKYFKKYIYIIYQKMKMWENYVIKKKLRFSSRSNEGSRSSKAIHFFSPKTYVKKCIHHYFLQLINFIHKL